MNFSLPRGLRDLEPDDYTSLEMIRETFISTCKLFGFKAMEPSPIELLATLEAKAGAGIRDEIYCFKDKSGRDVGLRFDLTVGITRYVTSHRGLQLPVKMGAFSGMWRYDEPQYGRFRWFYQWDAEIFGPSNAEADAEVIEFTYMLFKRLGLKSVEIRIGDRRLVEDFIRTKLSVTDNRTISEMLRALDKIGKKTLQEILDEYEVKGVRRVLLEQIIGLGKMRGPPEKVFKELETYELQSRAGLSDLSDMLKARQVRDFILDLGIVRGLDYYTGIVFETYRKEDAKLGALAGGGRFDSLPKIYGRQDMGATGVAGGVDRTILALKEQHLKQETRSNIFVYICYVSKELSNVASNLASQVRREGVPTELELLGRSLHRQLEVASSAKIPYVIIVAPREHSQGKVVLRNMLKGSEETLALTEVALTLRRQMHGSK